MDKKTILIALVDEDEKAGVLKHLSEDEFDIIEANDGAKAMEIALNRPVDFIIIDADVAVISGEKVFKILRNNPNTSNVPFLFVSDMALDIRGFRIGTDVAMIRPFQVEEIYTKLRQTLIFITSDDSKAIGSKEMEGKLTHMSIADLLQILHFNKKEGELRVTSGSNSGTIFIKDGDIFNAKIGEVEDEKAFYRITTWTKGNFSFQPKQIEGQKLITSSTSNLLMEGMRQLDEFDKEKHKFPDNDSILKTKTTKENLPAGLKPIIYEIINLLEFYPKVESLVDHCSYPDYEIYTNLVNLIGRGILEEVKGERAEGQDLSDGLITPTEAIRIKEKIVSRWSDMLKVNFGKLFVAPATKEVAAEFIDSCKLMPSFFINKNFDIKQFDKEGEVLIGEVGRIKLYGAIEVIVFFIPPVLKMTPLLRSFSTNLIGYMNVLDNGAAQNTDLKVLSSLQKKILSHRDVPLITVCMGSDGIAEGSVDAIKAELELTGSDLFHIIKKENLAEINTVFETFLKSLLKEDYKRTQTA